MKKLLMTMFLVLCSRIAMASGPLDGIYYCDVLIYGYNYPSYVTLNGHSDGGTVFAVAAVSPSSNFFGYGIGTATTNSFSGTTMFGAPFNFSATPASGRLTGTVGVLWYGSMVNATASCTKIW